MQATPLTTSNATTTTLATLAPEVPSARGVVLATFYVTALAANGDAAGYVVQATVKILAGTMSLVGSPTAVATHEDDGTWGCTADVAGNALRVRVTGKAGLDIVWRLDRVLVVESAPSALSFVA